MPYRRSSMAANAPCHLYCNLKIFEISKFSDVRFSPPPPCMLLCTLITMYGSCMWLTCMHTAPLHLPKKVTEKPSVNHIGSSTSHQWMIECAVVHSFRLFVYFSASARKYNVTLDTLSHLIFIWWIKWLTKTLISYYMWYPVKWSPIAQKYNIEKCCWDKIASSYKHDKMTIQYFFRILWPLFSSKWQQTKISRKPSK